MSVAVFDAPTNRPRYARDADGEHTNEVVALFNRKHITEGERLARIKARRKIVQAANRYSVGATPLRRAPHTMRHVNRAVSVVRRSDLVPVTTLALAGFNIKASEK